MLFEIFQYEFMIRALIAGGVIGLIAPLIGSHLVVRGYSLLADTLSHVALAGVAIGLLLGTQPVPVAVLATVIAAIGIQYLSQHKTVYGESILAIVLSSSLALAVVLMSASNSLNVDLLSFLFGSITTVSTVDLYYIVALGAVVVITLFTLYKELFLISFDEDVAQAGGISVGFINGILLVLAAITVALAMRVVGVLLIGALVVIPVVTAQQRGTGFRNSLIVSVILSLVAVYSGIILSYYLDIATGGTIVLVALGFFILGSLLRR